MLYCTAIFSAAYDIDQVNFSTVPPDSLDPKKIPQLICLGFDDNKYYSGLQWARDMLKDKKNPAGTGNKATFDGTAARATFFLISHEFYILEPQPWVYDTVEYLLGDSIQAVRKQLHDQGHEIGNHTRTHNILSPVMNETKWTYEILTCNKHLVNDMGIPPMDIYGFRTPYLDYASTTFTVLKKLGFLYDCTLEDGSMGSNSGDSHIFPHTLHNGHLFLPALKIPGLWETPHCAFMTGTAAYTTKGFDSNLWPVATNSQGVSSATFLSILKNSLNRRYEGNRAPMDIGLHTDYYAPENTGTTFNAGCTDRRNALAAFIDYALTLPDVRIVPMIDFIRWMRRPVTLDNDSLNDSLGFITTLPSGNLIHPAVSVTTSVDNIGSSIVTSWQGDGLKAAVTLNAHMNNGAIAGFTDIIIGLSKTIQDVRAMKVVYKSDFPVRIALPQQLLAETRNSYCMELPSAADWTSRELIVNDLFFKKPRNCPDVLDTVDLDLSRVSSIAISPLLLDTVKSGTLMLKELICYGAGELSTTPVKSILPGSDPHDVRVVSCMNNGMRIRINRAGIYSFIVRDLKGRTITAVTRKNYALGNHLLHWLKMSAGSAVFIVQIRGTDKEMVQSAVKM